MGNSDACRHRRHRADLLFAIDSIPAVFGLATDLYLVFTAHDRGRAVPWQ